jgi:hypothetical protein
MVALYNARILLLAGNVAMATATLLRAKASDCDSLNTVVFDSLDKELHVRTMVVEDSNHQRMLVLTAENDTSMPCSPRWWLDHNPQGVVQCAAARATGKAAACDISQCKADVSDVQLGYVRTMLASAIFVPQAHTMSAICIELGCRSRITRSRVGTLLETNKVQWTPRTRLERVLIIGLGSSTMANWFRQQLPDTELHIAELVPGVASAAPCFGLDTANGHDKRLHVHVGDGRTFLEQSEDGKYDAILVDAFDHDASLPACLRTSEFFAAVRRKLLPGGALSFNLYSDGRSKTRIVKALMKSFENSHIWVGDAPGAVGIQEVVTAFASGWPSSHLNDHAETAASGRARDWWGAAHYRLLRSSELRDVKAFEDASECPNKNAPHHG